jgi:hypothetical protein
MSDSRWALLIYRFVINVLKRRDCNGTSIGQVKESSTKIYILFIKSNRAISFSETMGYRPINQKLFPNGMFLFPKGSNRIGI